MSAVFMFWTSVYRLTSMGCAILRLLRSLLSAAPMKSGALVGRGGYGYIFTGYGSAV